MFKNHFHTYVAGIKHHRKAFYALDLEQREHSLELIEDPENKHDPNAIKVVVDGKHIGYVPKEKTAKVRKFLSKIYEISAEVELDGDFWEDVEIFIWYKK